MNDIQQKSLLGRVCEMVAVESGMFARLWVVRAEFCYLEQQKVDCVLLARSQ
jgi:hypothetical protein